MSPYFRWFVEALFAIGLGYGGALLLLHWLNWLTR